MADIKTLTPELIALVHHLELNRAGWWEESVRKLLLTAFHLRGDKLTLTPREIRDTLIDSFSVAVEESTIKEHLRLLAENDDVLEPQVDHFKATEAALKRCAEEVATATALESAVRARFKELLFRHCPTIDPLSAWSRFLDKFLIPLVRQLGANTYQLLEGSMSFDQQPQIGAFLACFESAYTPSLDSFLREFLNPADASLRRYVLRTMNAFFVVRAGGLTKDTVDRLASRAKGFAATLFFDSNVLFSLLGLHENPADESSRKLVALVHRLSTEMPIKLRVLPPTLDEMKRVLKASQEAVINLRIASSLLRPAINAGLTGITVKYLALVAERKRVVAPADYFEPYLRNLVTILHDSGVEVFNADTTQYRTRQDVVDDIIEQLEREKLRYGPAAKDYERLEHDLILWHFVSDKRPPRPDSPLDARYWIVTADFRLLGFDAFKRRGTLGEIPTCLHPVALVQLLQFWVPMDDDLESALFSAIRSPTVLAPHGDNTEKVSLQILSALSTFENIGDMPEETTTRILLNEALRHKLALEKEVEKQIQLVKEALIEENKLAEERIRLEKAKTQQVEEHSKALGARLADTLGEVATLKTGLEQALERERNLKAGETAAREREQAASREIERLIGEQKSARERTRRRDRAIFATAYLTLLALLILGDIAFRHLPHKRTTLTTAEVVAALLWMFLVWLWGSRSESTRDWPPFKHAMRVKVWIVLAVVTGIIGGAAWEAVRPHPPAKPPTAPSDSAHPHGAS